MYNTSIRVPPPLANPPGCCSNQHLYYGMLWKTLITHHLSKQHYSIHAPPIHHGVAANGRKNQSWLGGRSGMVQKVSCDDKYHVTLLQDIMTWKGNEKIWIIAALKCLFLYGIYKLSFWQVDVRKRYLKGWYNLSCVKICIQIWLWLQEILLIPYHVINQNSSFTVLMYMSCKTTSNMEMWGFTWFLVNSI